MQSKTTMGVTYFLKEVLNKQEQPQLDLGECVPSLELSTEEKEVTWKDSFKKTTNNKKFIIASLQRIEMSV